MPEAMAGARARARAMAKAEVKAAWVTAKARARMAAAAVAGIDPELEKQQHPGLSSGRVEQGAHCGRAGFYTPPEPSAGPGHFPPSPGYTASSNAFFEMRNSPSHSGRKGVMLFFQQGLDKNNNLNRIPHKIGDRPFKKSP